jgi:hypothetical protein
MLIEIYKEQNILQEKIIELIKEKGENTPLDELAMIINNYLDD